MHVTIMSDEVSSDLESALELIRSWDVGAVEIRRAGDQRYPDVSEYWQVRVPQMVKEYGLRVAAISPGLFKIRYPGAPGPFHFHRGQDIEQWERESAAEQLLDHHVNVLLPDSIEVAKMLDTRMIIVWAFGRHDKGPAPEGAIQVLRHAAQKAAAAGVTLAIEVEDLGERVAEIVRRVDHPALGISWAPASAYAAGELMPFPDGYAAVRPYVRHVHFKDVRAHEPGMSKRPDPLVAGAATDGSPWVLDGVVDWRGQIAQLKQDGYEGYVSVEPHVRPQIDAAKRTLQRLRTLIDEA